MEVDQQRYMRRLPARLVLLLQHLQLRKRLQVR
jgi:cell division protein FtsB